MKTILVVAVKESGGSSPPDEVHPGIKIFLQRLIFFVPGCSLPDTPEIEAVTQMYAMVAWELIEELKKPGMSLWIYLVSVVISEGTKGNHLAHGFSRNVNIM